MMGMMFFINHKSCSKVHVLPLSVVKCLLCIKQPTTQYLDHTKVLNTVAVEELLFFISFLVCLPLSIQSEYSKYRP